MGLVKVLAFCPKHLPLGIVGLDITHSLSALVFVVVVVF